MNAAIDHVPLTTPRDFTDAIIEQVAREHGVTPMQILGPWRAKHVVAARFAAIRRVYEARPNWSYPMLGSLFGGRDHTSIMNALDKTGGRVPRLSNGNARACGDSANGVASSLSKDSVFSMEAANGQAHESR